MGSARGLLHDDEELLAEVRPHPAVVAGPILLFLLALAGAIAIAIRYPGAPVLVAWLLAAMVGLPALWATARLLRWRAVRFVVTSSRLLYRRGVLGRDVVQLRLQRVAEVHCTQTLGGRLVGTGRLVFEVAGGDGPLVIEDVRRPRRLQRVITAQLDRLEVPYAPRAGYNGYKGYEGYEGYDPYHGYDPYGPYDPRADASTAAHRAVGTARQRPRRRGAATRGPDGRQGRGRTWSDTPPHGVLLDEDVDVDEDAGNVPRRLLQLDELRRRGILSEGEFAAKKAELLGRL